MNAQPHRVLNCPKCSASVRAGAQHAGRRLRCPKCGGTIKVPGATVSEGDDDDWFRLDEELPPDAIAGKRTPADSLEQDADANAVDPAAWNEADQWDLPHGGQSPTADWMDELPPMEEPPAAPPSHAATSSDDSEGLPALSSADLAVLRSAGGLDEVPNADLQSDGLPAFDQGDFGDDLAPAGEIVQETDEASEYRAKCPVCESIHFVKRQQAGKSIRCDDCHSNFVVPPPPKVKPKPAAKQADSGSPTFRLADVDAKRGAATEPGRKSVDAYLQAAEDEVEEYEDPHQNYDTPDVVQWLRETFGIFRDPSVIAYWLIISMIGALPGTVLLLLGSPILLILFGVNAIFYLSLILVTSFSILEAVANGSDRVEEWPTLNVGEWMEQLFVAGIAFVISSAPGFLLGIMLFGPGIMLVGSTMLSQFVFFPFVLLSILDNGSVLMPVSSDVTKSVSRCPEAWGGLYFTASLLFFTQFIFYAVMDAAASIPAMVFIDAFATVAFFYVYFALVGRLAFRIGQAINQGPEDNE